MVNGGEGKKEGEGEKNRMAQKGKAVAATMMMDRPVFPLPFDSDANEEEEGPSVSKLPPGFPPHGHPPLPYHPRHTSSKYDFVKVQVWLGDNADHYYVLSRFLVSRMLTVTKIPHHVAIKISLELKKLLIDNNLLDVSQSDLEANLFKLMERRGYGEEYINRYKMMTRFHHQRVPLVILVCGTACSGKSTIATQLAQRLNLPNVLQTDMVYELLRTSRDAPLPTVPVWEREFSSSEELITEFCRECRIVRKGLDGDVKKAMKDGKPIIIEGMHLDPGIYLINEESGVVASNSSEVALAASPNPAISDTDMPITREQNGVPSNPDRSLAVSSVSALENPDMLISTSNVAEDRLHGDASNITEEVAPNGFTKPHDIHLKGNAPEALKDSISNTRAKEPLKEFSKKQSTEIFAKAIVVPVVLKMDELDHKTLLEEWISCRCNISGVLSQVNKDDIVDKLMTIQEYLCSFESQGMIVVNISVTTFPQTLDQLHSYLLQELCKKNPQSSTLQEEWLEIAQTSQIWDSSCPGVLKKGVPLLVLKNDPKKQ